MRQRSRSSITGESLYETWFQTGDNTAAGTTTPATFFPRGKAEWFNDESDDSYRRAQRLGIFLMRDSESLVVERQTEYKGPHTAAYYRPDGTYNNVTYAWADDKSPSATEMVPTGYGFWNNNSETAPHVSNPYVEFSDPLGLAYRKQLVLAKAYERASQPDMQSLVSAAEFAKTADSAGRLVTMLPRFHKWFLKNRRALLTRNGCIRATGNLAATWLEYRYGFMQFYYDYQSLCAAIKRKGVPYRICRAGWRDTRYRVETLYDRVYNGPHFDWSFSINGLRLDRITAGVVVQCNPYTDFTRTWGLASPLTTAWELVPFSFVIDWFIDVSGALGALEGRYTQNVVASWVTTRSDWNIDWHFWRTGKITPNGSDYYHGQGVNDILTNEKATSVKREANPRFLFTLPEIRINLNWKRFTDAAALLRQLRHNALR